MKKVYVLLSMLPIGIMAQNFSEVQTDMKNFYYSASDVGHVDNNGFQDIVINGAVDTDGDGSADTSFNEVYKNNGSTLTLYADLGMDATHLGDIKFIDYNNDGLADIISTGLSYIDIVNYKHYRFRNTGSGFVKEAELPGKIYGSMEVFDFNHDGLQDYAINGTQYIDGTGFVNKLDYYQNSAVGFQLFQGWMEGTQNSSFKMVDLNNDHLLDMVILGYDVNTNPIFRVYLNNSGTLTLSQTLLPLANGKIEFADFNADGYQDIVVAAQDENFAGYLGVFMNDGTGHLNIQQVNVPEISEPALAVGDMNNDGYYDFIVSGNDDNNDALVKVFLFNSANQTFTENTTTGLHSLGGPGFVHLLDYNNDHHLDVLLSGFDWADPGMPSLTKIFKNVSTETNLKPAPPTNLSLTKNGNRFNFSWTGATDDKTPVTALSYEITVGKTPGAYDIAKYIVTTPSWFLDLDSSVQNVYWSVRSIDASKAYSDRSTEATLGTQNIIKERDFMIYPNPASEKVFIKGEEVTDVEMYSIDGKKLSIDMSADHSLNVSHLIKGVYLLKVKIKDQWTTRKLIIK
ncbi:T9SS type A sorting domain-containing protein [Chryseobacterium sp. ISL-6]|uniref:T9SS type A sorting domain-containing protein n=1 Tax=Chryseobacterium sp. ISL-6 TaxID=2819143 RepID=UPI001BEBDC4C|nr:T9SS type A sorting domain-containing protein [Chryseobacterium sp. ISL-6]MBT2623093.1 T9SS type A sorting domain-containing protein [Chryseobacterium sp. ISL-6]